MKKAMKLRKKFNFKQCQAVTSGEPINLSEDFKEDVGKDTDISGAGCEPTTAQLLVRPISSAVAIANDLKDVGQWPSRVDDTLGVTLVCQRSSVVQHLDSNVGETVTTEPYPRDSIVCHNHKPTFGKHLRQKRSCEDLVIENKGETLPLLNWYNNLEKHLRQNSEVKISQDDAAF
ncbi:unnamed protein product [Clavelina lepadiformis]|uniref:Uncharacterized protein n=1 Tax=Clavelina lepadiformis TaxID=159417 RepID=A0ABP0GFC2_CLALP